VWSSNEQLVPHDSNRSSLVFNTNFGAVLPNAILNRTFYIDNVGSGNMTLSDPAVVSSNSSIFNALQPSVSIIPAGRSNSQTVPFTITFGFPTEGSYSAEITINNDARIRSPYKFTVAGRVVSPDSTAASTSSITLKIDPSVLVDSPNSRTGGNTLSRPAQPLAQAQAEPQLPTPQHQSKWLHRKAPATTSSAVTIQSRLSVFLTRFAATVARAAGIVPERVTVSVLNASQGLLRVVIAPSLDQSEPSPSVVTTAISTQLKDASSSLITSELGQFLDRSHNPEIQTVPVTLCADGVYREACPSTSNDSITKQAFFAPTVGVVGGAICIALAFAAVRLWRKRRAAVAADLCEPSAGAISTSQTGFELMQLQSTSG